MKTIIKLILIGIILNGVGRAGLAAWNYYELRDAAQQAVTFGAQSQPTEIRNEILRKAQELALPVPPDNVKVSRNGIRTQADLSYTQVIEVFPRVRYPMDLSFKVDAVSLTGLK